MKNKRDENIFVNFLSLLDVKYTKSFARSLFNEHPYKDSLFALSNMLNLYNIDNKAIQLTVKDDIRKFTNPFIAYYGSDFVIVTKVIDNDIRIIFSQGDEKKMPLEEFYKDWSGVVLIAETSENSIEPNYKLNQRKESFVNIENNLLVILFAVLILSLYIGNGYFSSIGVALLLIVNLIGVYVGYLLLLKQLHINSRLADKLCSMVSHSDCNNVLDSKEAKLWGVIGWSEVGLSYFISNVLLVLLSPFLLPYLAVINICGLPYSFWSIWFQKVKAKQWCVLCLIVQALLWSVFIVNLLFGYVHLPAFKINDIILAMCIYGLPFLLISLILPKFIASNKQENTTQSLRSLKLKKEVFLSLLESNKEYDVDKLTSMIMFGNKDAEVLISIFSNPHCGPCATLHKKTDRLLKVLGDKICIQYLFTSFGDEYENSTLFLIAAYMNNSQQEAMNIYDEWFEYRKYFREEFFKSYNYDLADDMIVSQRRLHKQWRDKSGLNFTPTIIINGRELPDIYDIEDLEYIL